MRSVAGVLAEAFVAGPWQRDALVDRGRRALGRRWRGLPALVGRVLAHFGDDGRRPRTVRLAAFLRVDPALRLACKGAALALRGGTWPPPVMAPTPGAPASWPVPPLTTPAALADWLGLDPAALDWFADAQGRGGRRGPAALRHYDYRWQPKAGGSARLIERPRPRLKAIQRRLLGGLLEAIPPHDSAHGFRRGRSVRTYVAPHVGQAVVLKMDLRDFFPTISSARVSALFLTAGYPEPVACRLAGLCTSRVPPDVWEEAACPIGGPDRWRARRLYAAPHLPQGAPTSPALANLAAYRLDARLAALAESASARYTRYADDLAFSGGPDFARSVGRFPAHVSAIAVEEGLVVHHRKTRVMRQGVRQRVAGVVLNDRPNLPRPEYDILKATLHNCLRNGPEAENRDGRDDFRAHLAGRIAHVASLNPDRGRRLRAAFDRIAW